MPLRRKHKLHGTAPAPAKLDDGWSVTRPQEQDRETSLVCSIVPRLDAWNETNVHAVVLVRRAALAYVGYFTGGDQNWGRPL